MALHFKYIAEKKEKQESSEREVYMCECVCMGKFEQCRRNVIVTMKKKCKKMAKF